MGFTYKWKDYSQSKPGSYSDYTPTYQKYATNRPTSTYTPTQYSDKGGAYAKEISGALGDLNKTIANKPGAYNSQYNDRINNLIDQMANRKFQYDAANDSAYQLMRDNYINLGRQAAADTAGQAAGLTGGYGNSYGTVAANQAYQGYLNQLNDRIPELQQMALSLYQQEGSDLQNQYNMLSDRDIAAYQKYRDSVADWQTDRSYYDTALNNLRTMNQNIWSQNEQNLYNANKQAWDNYITLSGMNDSNYWNAQNIATDRYKQALDNYWNGVDRTESAKQNAWNRASTDYWNRQNLDETSRHNKAGEKTDAYKAWTDRYNAYSTRQHYNNSDATDYYSAQETSRHNKANESNDAYSNKTARINASTSQYNAKTDRMNAENKSTATTYSDGSVALTKDNKTTKKISKSILPKEKYRGAGNNGNDYKKYVRGILEKAYNNGEINEAEVQWLYNKHVFS